MVKWLSLDKWVKKLTGIPAILVVGVLLFGLPVRVLGQCYFFEVYDDGGGTNFSFGIADAYDGGFVIASTTDSIDGMLVPIKVNDCGNVVWKNHINISTGSDWGLNIIRQEDSSFVIIGGLYNPIEQKSSNYLYCISDQGDSLWLTEVNVGLNDRGPGLIKKGNGKFIIAGHYELNDPNHLAYLAQTDSLGNISWKHDYGYPESHVVTNLAKTFDGGYLLSGYSYNGINQSIDLFLIKTDTTGTFQWQKLYGSSFTEALGHGVQTDDWGFITVGYKEFTFETDVRGYIVKTDPNGSVEWERIYGDPQVPLYFIQIEPLDDGTYIVIGSIDDPLPGGNRGIAAYLARIASNGDVIWEHTYSYYGGRSHNYIEDLKVLSNGDLVMTGYVIPVGVPVNSGNDAFILKTDSCGYTVGDTTMADFTWQQTGEHEISFTGTGIKTCGQQWYFGDGDSSAINNPNHIYPDTGTYPIILITKAGNTSDTVTQLITVTEWSGIAEEKTSKYSIYPNPVLGSLHIESSTPGGTFSLYNLLGGEALTQPLTETHTTLDVSTVPAGVYVYCIKQNGQAVYGKVVVE